MVMLNSGKKWIKISEVKDGDVLTIKDEGWWQENNKFKYSDGNPKQDFIITVDHNGEEKQMTINGTNRSILTLAYGRDTALWVGKKATIIKKWMEVSGKDREVIRLSAEGISQADQGEASCPVDPDADLPF